MRDMIQRVVATFRARRRQGGPMRRPVPGALALASVLVAGGALAGCVVTPDRQVGVAGFGGRWSVQWCDRTNPGLDCGGFDLDLIQEGERLCGDFGGALVNLRQVDEGHVTGTVVGDTAILAVESQRSQSIVLVRAELRHDTLHWRQIDTLVKGNGDVSVIATDDRLARGQAAQEGEVPAVKTQRTCASDFR